MKKVFVYGTLRKGMYNFDKYYKAHDSFRDFGYVKGTLYTIKGKEYPALIPGNEIILGEIHHVPDEVQAEVDLMECYFGEGNPENEYDKILCEIYDAHGKMIDHLPVYFYNLRKPENRAALGEVITCNDYVAYVKEGHL